ncbi:aspartyl protease family protein 2 [Silene latifolia]|uniref:aspartyl protease family protein 2 n=1 Tax=Silene latifolia TaxID=37657 RepID=UPI003D76F607
MSLPTSLLLLLSLLLILLSPTTSHSPNYLKLQLIHTNTLLHNNSTHFSLLHHHRHRNRPRIHTPIVSGAATGSGQYFASLTLGTPPQRLLLVADTGSDLTWLRSSSSRQPHYHHRNHRAAFLLRRSRSFRALHCLHTKCHLLPHQQCRGPHSSCQYTYSYADGSVTSGILSTDVTSFNTTLTFGCAFNLSGPSITGPAFEGAAGVMGLGKGPLSFTEQLGKRFGNRFSYCLPDYTISPPKISYLVIGGRHGVVSRNTRSTPLLTNIFATTFYYIEILYVIIENVKLPINPSVWGIDDLGNGGTIIDSGTTLTFFPEPAYRQIVKEMADRVKLPRLSKASQVFDLCYNVSGVSKLNLPSLKLVFAGDSVFDPPPGNYFIDTAKDVKCLALQAVTSPAGNAVIGNLMQQGFLFEFDNDRSRLLFSRSGCGNPR